MLNLNEIHKPTTVQDALKFLQQPDTVALAGGTNLIAEQRRDVRAVVDLSGLGLAYIRESSGAIVLGAMTTLSALNDSPILRALANGVIAQAAHRSAASILRNQATLAGTIIAEPDGILAVALLALDAQVTLVGSETRQIAIENFWREGAAKSLVTEIAVPIKNPRAALHTVARTPSDQPIVGVIASAQIENQVARDVRIALGGVSETALRASAAEKILEGQTLNDAVIENAVGAMHASPLHPRGDYRGSAEYRREMAIVLTRRAVRELIT
ncbi:MAG: FAD binding domain-containing protein [Chloroflexi bacterium]|nr:FAD binding domain-containing protein [Chloroflexota bacterium]